METQTVAEPKKKQFTGEMAVMGKEGDTKHMWDKDKPVEVEMARKIFDEYVKKGFTVFSVAGEKGEKDKQVRDFDPNAGRYIFVPPVQAG
jgi:hypothetical protein